MKKLSFVLCLLLTCTFSQAQTTDNYPKVLVVEAADGSQHVFELSSKPKVTFGQQRVTFANEETEVEYLCTEIRKYYFVRREEVPVGIAQREQERLVVRQTARNVYVIEGAVPAMGIKIADIAGRSFAHCISKTAHATSINLTSAPAGIYIIHLGRGRSLKILCRHE